MNFLPSLSAFKVLWQEQLASLALLGDYLAIKQSVFFDKDFYLSQNPDVRRANLDPLIHYLRHGWKEGRNPSIWFDNDFYLKSNPDVRMQGVCPLAHFVRRGLKTGRSPCPPLHSKCNICWGEKFSPGPAGRLSANGLKPHCTGCGSLERHRAIRGIWSRLPFYLLRGAKALQFSKDFSVDPSWFSSYEVSVYGGENSLDLQKIDKPDNSYDIVICNHVLEHVADDRLAFRELLRITTQNGLLQISFPNPHAQETTQEWNYPRENDHGHYRIYGRDAIGRFLVLNTAAHCLSLVAVDPVTAVSDRLMFFSKCLPKLRRLKKILANNEPQIF